jgi:NAD(P)-dependent dehydrogenase (short-subunit alcohol dehydrogenase family)
MKIMIQGAGRGIGLALAQRAVTAGATQLFLTARDPQSTPGYAALPPSQETPHKITWWALDNTQPDSIAQAGAQICAEAHTLDRVICCAGILKDATIAPEKRIADIDAAALLYAYQVNAMGPILLAKALWPALRGEHKLHFASLSARVGSISDNNLGGWYAYRASKAAQNQLMRTMSIELARYNANACVATLHPGTVDTSLSKPFQAQVNPAKLFTPDYSADRLWAVLGGLTPANTGGFFAFDGSPIAY